MTQKPYTIVDTTTGQIVQSGFAPANQMDSMRAVLEEGQILRERAADPKTHRASKTGSIIKKSKKMREAEEIEQARRQMLSERRALLADSDWTDLPSAPKDKHAAWQEYRQALRDLPANTPDPRNVKWPEPPK